MFNDLLRDTARTCGDLTAITSQGTKLTYSDVYERACRLTNALTAAGVRPGEVVASLGRNQLASFEELAAVALGNFIRSPLYLQDTPSRQAFMLERVGSTALIIDAACWPPLAAMLQSSRLAALRVVLVRGGGAGLVSPARDYDTALAEATSKDPMLSEDAEATYIIRFSAGTTGMPKPVAHSRRAYALANEEVLSSTAPLVSDDVYLAVSPYSHASGNMVWPFVRVGGSHLLMTGAFDPDSALDLIEQHRCTTLFLVPTMIQRLLCSPRCVTTDLSSIRRIVYGAAPIPQDLIQRALDTFGDVLSQSYGQSEIVPITCLTPADHRANAEGHTGRLASAGRVTANTGVRIEGMDGSILTTGQVGQIVGRSPGAMKGIFGDPIASAERITRDGWVRTGDLGHLDADGYLFVVDRMDDMIISGGFNIAPSEIEDALNRHEDVLEAIAFGVPDPQWGATPIAVVRLKANADADAATLMEWCCMTVGKIKKPSRIILTVDPLPINAAGKLMRRVAKQLYVKQV